MCESDRILSEGDVIRIDDEKWSVIETHGHCPGHICLVGEAGIISGDNAVLFGTILVPSSDGNMNQYLAGLERLRDLDPRFYFPATVYGCEPKEIIDTIFETQKTTPLESIKRSTIN